MAVIIPYVRFGGKAVEALGFYKSVFGGEPDITLVKDSAMAANMPAEMGGLVFHSELKSPRGVSIMASDLESQDTPLVKGNTIAMGIMCDSDEQLRDWSAKLASNGGKVTWAPTDTDWGAVYGETLDQYGITWMLNFDKTPAAA